MITPQTEHPDIAKSLGIPKLYIKREDLHPLGSHKGRSIPVMIEKGLSHGQKYFALSSSGNAAIAALRYISKKNLESSKNDDADKNKISLSIFIGENVNTDKENILKAENTDKENIIITRSKRPLKALFEIMKGQKHQSLRQSTDPNALIGYETLASEISEIPELSAVFVPTSSGTTAEAIARFFNIQKINQENGEEINMNNYPTIHIVQTPSCHPMIDSVSSDVNSGSAFETDEEISLADAIVDKTAYRKEALLETLGKTREKGWIATNEDIKKAQELLRLSGVQASYNGSLGLAGLIRAISMGKTFSGSVICIITGK